LVPTLTSDLLGQAAVVNGYTLNLTADGSCTSPNVTQCVAQSNVTTDAILNPVRSARLNTMGKVSISYGKVEVRAKMPTGDWLWPAIWLLPTNNTYGSWPLSGEIDIAETRGNNMSYPNQGINHIQSALHWGAVPGLMDQYWRTWGLSANKLHGYNEEFHTYALEWTDKYITTYIDNRVSTNMLVDFTQSFWTRGQFPQYWQNGTTPQKINNPWFSSESNAAPFDQSFYLILDLAVGGTNGFFPDNIGGKPWLDSSPTAMSDFWAARERWYPTWPTDLTKRAMAIQSIKMWQQC